MAKTTKSQYPLALIPGFPMGMADKPIIVIGDNERELPEKLFRALRISPIKEVLVRKLSKYDRPHVRMERPLVAGQDFLDENERNSVEEIRKKLNTRRLCTREESAFLMVLLDELIALLCSGERP